VEPGIGRITRAHGDYYHLVCNESETEILARKKKSVFKFRKLEDRNVRPDRYNEDRLNPITGDFVRFRHNAQGESLITDVLPRYSHFERKDPTARRQAQTLAVNFDTLFIMMSLNENFSLPRLKRYLDLAEDMGDAEAVVVLTKRDLAGDGLEAALDAVRTVRQAAPKVVAISAVTGEGVDQLAPYVRPRHTVAFIGSSGVGKSTLLNTLYGEELFATQEIQEWSGKGRHTTTSRELVRLPNGALVLDTPGIREIGRLGEEELELMKGEASHRWRIK